MKTAITGVLLAISVSMTGCAPPSILGSVNNPEQCPHEPILMILHSRGSATTIKLDETILYEGPMNYHFSDGLSVRIPVNIGSSTTISLLIDRLETTYEIHPKPSTCYITIDPRSSLPVRHFDDHVLLLD